jgi:hypothetical protein
VTGAEVDVVTGELVPRPEPVKQLTPTEARAQADWVREMQRAVLTEGEDYGVIPGTERPTLFKSGAEMLLLAAGLGFNQIRVDDNDAREHRGVTYRCEIHRGDILAAVCEAYAGYDEYRFKKGGYTAPWNTLLKMAQKRALVGATLNAVAASGLFVADAEDTDQPNRAAANRGDQAPPPCNEDAAAPSGSAHSTEVRPGGAAGAILMRVDALGTDARRAFDQHVNEMRWPWPPSSGAVIQAADRYLDKLEAAR